MNAKELNCDVVIAGCGVSGLYAALNLPASANIIMLTKTTVEECDSMLAQGGICVLHDEADYDAFYEDTMRAGHYENRAESVDIMIRSSRDVINDLVKRGVEFEHEQNGELAYTREGAHSRPRICFHGDITGEEITTKLLANVRRLPNVSILEHVEVVDIIESPQRDRCIGVECVCRRGLERARKGTAWLFARRTPCWLPAALAEPTSAQPIFPALRAMPAVLPATTVWSWSIWTTCRFTPPAFT